MMSYYDHESLSLAVLSILSLISIPMQALPNHNPSYIISVFFVFVCPLEEIISCGVLDVCLFYLLSVLTFGLK